jgi:uncharacterized protein (TIGR03545 family)
MSEDKKELKRLKKEAKKNKPKGPIRTGAVVPFIIVTVLVTAFNYLLLETTVKKSMEFLGTKINGAEVNVGAVSIDLKSLRTVITKVEFTDKNEPSLNSFEIGRMEFKALWDALLRAKLVIDIVEVKDILIQTKRRSKGYIVPPEEKSEESKATQKVLAQASKEFEGNILGDIAGLISGNPGSSDKGVEGSLKSKKKYEEISKEIEVRSAQVDKAFESLPKTKELNSLKTRFGQIRWNDLGNIAKAPKVIKEIDGLKKDVDSTKKKFDEANKIVNENIKYINDSQNDIKRLVKEDMNDIQKRMKIPKMDAKSIAKVLFGSQAMGYIKKGEEYHAKIKDYLPPKKAKEDKKPEFVKTARGKGRDYQFGTPKSYPPVWIKRVSINSKNTQGMIDGEIKNITNNQKIINKPTTLKLKADLFEKGITGVTADGIFDHREASDDKLFLNIGKYPVANKALSKSDSAKLIINKADGNAIFNAHFKGDSLNFSIDNYYRNIQYDTDAKSSAMKEVLGSVAQNTKTISLKAKATGKIKSLKWDIQSNLAKALQDSVKKLVQGKIDTAKKKIREDIENQLGGQKKQIDAQLNAFKSKYQGQLDQGKKQFSNIQSDIDKKRKSEEKKAKKGLENKAKKELENKAKKLFKGFKL